jgi:hypothetical protein
MGHAKYIFISIFVFMVLVGVLFVWFFFLPHRIPLPAPPSDLFSRYVSDPIPDSVTEIRAGRTRGFDGYGYTFRFRISKADVDVIVNSRPFNKVTSIDYQKDILHCMWVPASGPTALGQYVYSPGVRKPSWFKLEEWDDPEAYIIYEKKKNITDLWLLVYNKDAGEAYFIVENVRMW